MAEIQSKSYRSPRVEQADAAAAQALTQSGRGIADLIVSNRQHEAQMAQHQADKEQVLTQFLLGQRRLDASDAETVRHHKSMEAAQASAREATQATRDEAQKLRQERLYAAETPKITSDYNKIVGSAAQRAQAGQTILEALKAQDETSLGRIKVALPKLEGETFRPTDKERELILQMTAPGALQRLKTLITGGGGPAISQEQASALENTVRNQMSLDQGLLDRANHEVRQRWGQTINSMSPQQQEALFGSLGMSTSALANKIQTAPPVPPLKGILGGAKPAAQPVAGLAPQAPAASGLTPQEQAELLQLRSQFGGK